MKISKQQAKRIIDDADAWLEDIRAHVTEAVSEGKPVQIGNMICSYGEAGEIAEEIIRQITYHAERRVMALLGTAYRGDPMSRKGANPHEGEAPMTTEEIESLLAPAAGSA
jgi:hypothetical protein